MYTNLAVARDGTLFDAMLGCFGFDWPPFAPMTAPVFLATAPMRSSKNAKTRRSGLGVPEKNQTLSWV
jgi:hypothetical protein